MGLYGVGCLKANKLTLISAVLVQCTQVNKMLVMLLLVHVYPHRAGLKNMPGHGGQAYFSSLPVARHIFQAYPVWIYTQSNITSKLTLS